MHLAHLAASVALAAVPHALTTAALAHLPQIAHLVSMDTILTHQANSAYHALAVVISVCMKDTAWAAPLATSTIYYLTITTPKAAPVMPHALNVRVTA